uniref:Uncharacterized protein WOXB n=1 Tax=Ceratopteris richardii TaxID=49495 RepID=G8YXX1_CERRI|nr:hypothetical protein [Ceratopteris richardii]
MVFHLAFENHVRQHLLQLQMMSGSASDQLSQMNATNPQQAAMYLYCLGRLTPPILGHGARKQWRNLEYKLFEQVGIGDEQHGAGGEGGSSSSASSHGTANTSGACTPRTRWCPTPEQINVLETLFNSGTTTPTRAMIVDIASCLNQFGSIVEANVFYWFQNRKARAKRKLRMQAQLHQESAGATSISASSSPTNGFYMNELKQSNHLLCRSAL